MPICECESFAIHGQIKSGGITPAYHNKPTKNIAPHATMASI